MISKMPISLFVKSIGAIALLALFCKVTDSIESRYFKGYPEDIPLNSIVMNITVSSVTECSMICMKNEGCRRAAYIDGGDGKGSIFCFLLKTYPPDEGRVTGGITSAAHLLTQLSDEGTCTFFGSLPSVVWKNLCMYEDLIPH